MYERISRQQWSDKISIMTRNYHGKSSRKEIGCMSIWVYHICIDPLIAGNMPNTKTPGRGATVRKCPFCPFQSSNHTVWRDHMAECYETKFFCKQCNYSTEKKTNSLWHLKVLKTSCKLSKHFQGRKNGSSRLKTLLWLTFPSLDVFKQKQSRNK